MSYDLIGVRLAPGEDPQTAVDRLEELADDDTQPGDPAWAQIERLGDALAALSDASEVEDVDGGVEVSLNEFQIHVYEHEATVTIPYWEGTGAEALAQVDRYLEVLRGAGFTVWDPQTEQVVGDRGDVAAGFAASMDAVRPVLEAAEAPRRRRWPFGRR